MEKLQKTIKNSISYKGIGLHTGKEVTLTFQPAPPYQGVVFVREDLPNSPKVEARVNKAVSNTRGTAIGKGEVKVCTIEHILAALSGLGIDNINIKMNGEEIPAGDGSALPFVRLIQEAEVMEQSIPRDFFKVEKPLWIEEGDRRLIVLPDDNLRISYTVDFPRSPLKSQFAEFTITEETFIQEIAPSRTFGFMEEIEELRKKNLVQGGSLENAVVIDEKGVINKEGLRFLNEPVRHKILDLIGDLYLLGRPIKAHILAVKSGHLFNVKLVQRLEELKNVEKVSLDIRAIERILPHRYPFLLVDKILELGKKEIVGVKNFTVNEPFFGGHFPGHPIVPGALIIEAMAQVAGVYLLNKSENQGKLAYFAGIDKARFRKPVVPGDQLITKVEILNLRKTTGRVQAVSKVGGKIVAEAVFLFTLVERQGEIDGEYS
ncbi:MAG: bifunctional UDP-3-O-[3-hydroxymyristoyl] N-acetylglucosamine deacetylase/3-hydroxyacyl-ACP dehydratase [Candidatus Aerophobetes bacterium]|nr:bifunctional UDP-3-O-[3-hydroxymyristoyl] N-acetylglucosamine deacetylase/3-hydroxyacyl-ACP dehydratase [Candidatus Aerophobetes bacterium]